MQTYPSEPNRIIAITGPPGAGKTTVARALTKTLDAVYISSGDIAREVDPEALERGEMADRELLRGAFEANLDVARRLSGVRIIVDGLPRDPTDVELLPEDETMLILLNCLPHVAKDRQLRRGRPGDTADLINRRTDEQRALMELDDPHGWVWDLIPWKQRLATDKHLPEAVIRMVTEYIFGRRSTIG